VSYLKFSEHDDYKNFENEVNKNKRSVEYTEEELKEWEEWAKKWEEQKQDEA